MAEGNQGRTNFQIPDVGRIDVNKIGSMYGVGGGSAEPDFIAKNARGRDEMGQLMFNTGVCWLGGFSAGGAHGIYRGWKDAPSSNFRIRMNSVLNGVSRNGSRIGNAVAVVAFGHTSLVLLSEYLRLEEKTGNELATPVAAGFLTGLIYKSTTGPRGALLAAAIGTVGSCAYWYGGPYVYNVLLGKGGRY